MPLPPVERLPTEAAFALELAQAQWQLKFRSARSDAFGYARWSVVHNNRNYGSWPDPNFAVLVRDREVVIQTVGELGLPSIPTGKIHRMLETMRPEQIIMNAMNDQIIERVLKEMSS